MRLGGEISSTARLKMKTTFIRKCNLICPAFVAETDAAVFSVSPHEPSCALRRPVLLSCLLCFRSVVLVPSRTQPSAENLPEWLIIVRNYN